MSFLRTGLERVSRRLVLTRRLPVAFGGRPLAVTPGAALAYWYPLDGGRWRDLFDFAGHCVQPGDTVWDIGANLGVFGFAAAHRAGPAGEVLALEADPWLADLMRRSVAAPAPGAAPVQVLCAAAAAGVGLENFATPERARSGSHLASAAGASEALVGRTVATNPVITVNLDWLLARRRAPAVVKIDVEGAELPVLQGAAELLARHRPRLLLEVYEASADAITALLHADGYDLYDFSAGWAARQPVARAVYHTLALPRSSGTGGP
jgi:FkbM family methyltransferase